MEDPCCEKRVLVSWSGGKDSCVALREIQKTSKIHVAALLTTVTRDFDRISMHGVRRSLLERQATSLEIPLRQVLIAKGARNEEYEARMGEIFADISRSRDRYRSFWRPFS
jgi:diphthamide synthase (EF-2-diphthine--ammonia ligase)